MTLKFKKNYLLEKVTSLLENEPKGKILDLGCGDGHYSFELKKMGFIVIGADGDTKRFKYHSQIDFRALDLSMKFPFPDAIFDYVLFMEIIEHLRTPFFCIKEISRILKPKGTLFLSTPNILNIGSRLRFLFEGSFDFFREPTLDLVRGNSDNLQNIHIIPWRYQELEYLLFENGLSVSDIYTDKIRPSLKIPFLFLFPIMRLQYDFKQRSALKMGGIDYSRINKRMMSQELLYGRHLIIRAEKS